MSSFHARGSVVADFPRMLALSCSSRAPIAVTAALLVAAALLACTPVPQSRCVQCVNSSSSGEEGNSCLEGECVYERSDDFVCPAQRRGIDGTCAPQ